MKTAEEKAEKWLFENMPGFDAGKNILDIDSLALLLKEQDRQSRLKQDRDTRHACAETVLQMTGMAGAASLIPRKAAHDACMNVKAV